MRDDDDGVALSSVMKGEDGANLRPISLVATCGRLWVRVVKADQVTRRPGITVLTVVDSTRHTPYSGREPLKFAVGSSFLLILLGA